jgi:hypothetical protein
MFTALTLWLLLEEYKASRVCCQKRKKYHNTNIHPRSPARSTSYFPSNPAAHTKKVYGDMRQRYLRAPVVQNYSILVRDVPKDVDFRTVRGNCDSEF